VGEVQEPIVSVGLQATIEPAADDVAPAGGDLDGGAPAVTLHIVNVGDQRVEVLNPDLGQPSEALHWPWSVETYRASLLMSYGYLTISVVDEDGDPVEKEMIETWVTPALSGPIPLRPGASLDVPVPVGRFFPLAGGGRYRLTIEYGDASARARAEGTISVPVG
jgi:hypothetical protein